MATSTRPFTPLPDIESPEFTKQYELGVWRRMHGKEQGCGLVAVSYLVTNLKRYAQRGYFTSPDPSHLHHIGFFLGMYHGSILSPQTGEPRPEVTMLARLDHEQARRGYTVGREFCFVEATPDEQGDGVKAALLHGCVRMWARWRPTTTLTTRGTSRWLVCLGELSTQCFLMSAQEREGYAASYPVEGFAYWKQSAQEVQLCSTVVFLAG